MSVATHTAGVFCAQRDAIWSAPDVGGPSMEVTCSTEYRCACGITFECSLPPHGGEMHVAHGPGGWVLSAWVVQWVIVRHRRMPRMVQVLRSSIVQGFLVGSGMVFVLALVVLGFAAGAR